MWCENNFGRWFTPYHLLFLLLIVFGTARIIDAYQSVSITADERQHISAGVQWLVDGAYNYEELHPPLARVFVALLPHLSGLTAFQLRDWGACPRGATPPVSELKCLLRKLALAGAGVGLTCTLCPRCQNDDCPLR